MRSRELEEQPTRELTKTQSRRAEESLRRIGMWLPTAALFVLLCILTWMNEILDLPHVLFEAPRTPIDWREAILETGLIVVVALVAVSRLIYGATRLRSVMPFEPLPSLDAALGRGD